MKHLHKFFILLLVVCASSFAMAKKNDMRESNQAKSMLKSLPDSAFKKFYPPNMLEDFTYIKLAKEGWTTKEIFAITDDYVRKNRKKVRGTEGYVNYNKEWRPYWYGLVPNDTIKRRIDENVSQKLQSKVIKAFKAEADEYVPRVFYTPNNRMNGIRDKGMWRHNAILPASGRIHWIQTHPTDKDKLMIIPDGDGIWKTDNGGKNWIPVSDRIPNRFHRSQARGYAIPVDPDDWNHFFAMMENTDLIYETFDGGTTWQEVAGAKQVSTTGLKRGYAFKDAQGTLKFIGVVRNTYTGVNGVMYISENKGVSWKQIAIPTNLQDLKTDGSRAVWLQEIEFDPQNRDIVYFTSARGIYRSTDGLRYTNGKFNFERMNFKVYNQNKTQLLYEGNTFPVPYADGPMMLEIDPANSNRMWAALGIKDSPLHSALYFSDDKGATWVTLMSTVAKIGSGQVFGNESPGGWLGGFGVNFKEPNYMYGCSMSSAKSSDGGKTFNEFAWGIVMKGYHPNGNLYNVSSARHNADNHTIASTPSGRIFRASDAGMLMIDKDINGREWMNISGDMGQNLFYAARLNEFGDQTIIGNTQDVDNQTYRYGRWGTWRGYEGSTVCINPLSNETYFSGGGGGSLEGTSFGDSWQAAFSKADPVTGNWYLWRGSRMVGSGNNLSDIGVVKDIGRSVQGIVANTSNRTMANRDFALSRDLSIGTSFFVLRADANIVRFDNNSDSYITITRPSLSGYDGKCIAVNPENADEIYIGDSQNGVLKTSNGGKNWTSISKGTGGIPAGVVFNKIIFHEGSGDIYAVSNSSGIFLLENGSTTWRLWMKGYNPAAFSGAEINYATQEMMIYDYGRGIWIADLENPSDRFFRNGFKLKELSNFAGVRTLGIDSSWDIPLYYNYKWTVNGVERTESPYRYFTAADLQTGDRVKLTLTLREAPDVVTQSAEWVVQGATNNEAADYKAGNMLRTSIGGRMDLGHLNFFDNDFSVSLWIKPKTTIQAAIIGNRKLESRDQQGWLLYLKNGALQFTYSPTSNFSQPSYESGVSYERTETAAGTIADDTWTHVALTMEKNGNIKMYVNGVLKKTAVRQFKNVGLNSVQPLALLADGYEQNAMDGAADELKIWRKAISLEDIRREMYDKPAKANPDLVYYNDFNGADAASQKENFTQSTAKPRTRAIVSYPKMSMAVCASFNKYDTITSAVKELRNGSEIVAYVNTNKSTLAPVSISRFDNVYHASDVRGMSNEHFEFAPYVYKFDYFNAYSNTDSINLKLYMPQATDFDGEDVYIGSADSDKADWQPYSDAVKFENGYVVLKLRTWDINGKLIAFVKVKPAISLVSPAATSEGELYVYDSDKSETYPLKASLIKSMPAPTAPYGLISSNSFVQPGKLTFVNNVGTGSFVIQPDVTAKFNDSYKVSITGEDSRLIPYNITVKNKIAPKKQGNALQFVKGGATIGSASDYAALNNSNRITMMGWIRIDEDAFFTESAVKPVIFFRGGGYTTGIHFLKGEMRCHWNEESWSWDQATGLTLTTADKGKWIHVALVTTPTSISYFLNGKKFTVSRNMSQTHIVSALMLGRNQPGDTWFTGAIDQVALWSRSLSDAEVMKYMYDRVLLNDDGLVSYLNMDIENENKSLVDLKTNGTVETGGTVTPGFRSSFPFTLVSQSEHTGSNISSPDATIAVKMPTSIKGKYFISNIDRLPYNYATTGVVPVYNGHFVVNYNTAQTFGASDKLEFTLRSPVIKSGQQYNLGTRTMGNEAKFKKQAAVTATVDGEVTVSLNATEFSDVFEAIWFTTTANLPTVAAIVEGMNAENKVIIKNDMLSIPVTFSCTSENKGDMIELILDNENAWFDNSKIDFKDGNTVVRQLFVDKDKLNQNAFNTIKLSYIGAGGQNITLNLGLEATVELSVASLGSDLKITATKPTTSFEVKANIVRGVVLEPIKLKVESTLKNGISVGTDYLTVTGGEKIVNGFDYTKTITESNDGWNSTTNPYLANFLISKKENVNLSNVSPFVYRFDQDSKNFIPYDTRYFDSELSLRPLEPVFTQVNSVEAALALKAQGRSLEFNRRNTDYFQLSEEDETVMELWQSGKMIDRVVIRVGDGGETFVFGEDAPKMISFDSRVSHFYALLSGVKYSVKTLYQVSRDIPFGLRVPQEGEITFKVSKTFKNPEWKAYFKDNQEVMPITGIGELKTIAIPSGFGTNESRFALRMEMPTGTDALDASKPRIWATGNVCHVNNLSEGSKIQIYGVNGQLMVNETTVGTSWKTTLKAGVYTVKITNGEGKIYNGKIIIQ